MYNRSWEGYWISNTRAAAPYFRQNFELEKLPREACCFLCGLGWHELYINGQRADDRVLAPTITQFDKRASYIRYDISHLLRIGKNTVAVLLGSGLYNCTTECAWPVHASPWIDLPKMLCDIECDGEIILYSDDTWKTSSSPITFSQLRNGEHYDARLEQDGCLLPEFDDSTWENAVYCNPPGGMIVEEDLEPCRIFDRIDGKKNELSTAVSVYDFGVNLTGWCEIELTAPAGSHVRMEYAELVFDNGNISQENLKVYVRSGEFQTDRYTAKGGGVEIWHPRFTYHGFRYCRVIKSDAAVNIRRVTAHFIHNDFKKTGNFSSSSAVLNKLQEITCRSYLSNFTGIPTDCPHREKHGWLGDALLALETGMWNYDCVRASLHFNRIVTDTQRMNGQLPAVAPTGNWGYNRYNCPTGLMYLAELPQQILRFYGDDSAMKEFMPNIKAYVDFCTSMSHDFLLMFGLGDYSGLDSFKTAPVGLTSSCAYFRMAKILGEYDREYAVLAENIRTAVNRKYYRGGGIYADGGCTSIACALFYGVTDAAEIPAAVGELVRIVRENRHRAAFGNMGARYVPRVLAEYGYIDDVYQLFTQQEYPGWGHWVKLGATTLRERWNSTDSQNHIMFGDVSACMYEYFAGFKPGMKFIAPQFPADLDMVEASYCGFSIKWERTADGIAIEIDVPEDAAVLPVLRLPGVQEFVLQRGKNYKTVTNKGV